MQWAPTVYEAFHEARQRPFLDLLERIPLAPGDAGTILDAGCGTGKNTALLAKRFQNAEVVGVDASERMLMHAPTGARLRFVQADLARWSPRGPFDVVVSNAALHWIPHPKAMLGRLARWVAPMGVLAIQVPANFDAASHRIVRAVAAEMGIDADMGDHVLGLAEYAEELEGRGFTVEAWDTTYLLRLTGDDAVLRWLAGTTLRPYLAGEGKRLIAALRPRLREAYPSPVRFPFTRRFVVARKMGP